MRVIGPNATDHRAPLVKMARGMFESARDVALDFAAEQGEYFRENSEEAQVPVVELRQHWRTARDVARAHGSGDFAAWARLTDGKRERHLYVELNAEGVAVSSYEANKGRGGFVVVLPGQIPAALLPAPKRYFWPGVEHDGEASTTARYRVRW